MSKTPILNCGLFDLWRWSLTLFGLFPFFGTFHNLDASLTTTDCNAKRKEKWEGEWIKRNYDRNSICYVNLLAKMLTNTLVAMWCLYWNRLQLSFFISWKAINDRFSNSNIYNKTYTCSPGFTELDFFYYTLNCHAVNFLHLPKSFKRSLWSV